jgi:hypothetical protein
LLILDADAEPDVRQRFVVVEPAERPVDPERVAGVFNGGGARVAAAIH